MVRNFLGFARKSFSRPRTSRVVPSSDFIERRIVQQLPQRASPLLILSSIASRRAMVPLISSFSSSLLSSLPTVPLPSLISARIFRKSAMVLRVSS